MALFMDGVQLPHDLNHFKEAVYFLPLSSQKLSKQYLIIKALYLLKQRNIYKYFWWENLKKKAWT